MTSGRSAISRAALAKASALAPLAAVVAREPSSQLKAQHTPSINTPVTNRGLSSRGLFDSLDRDRPERRKASDSRGPFKRASRDGRRAWSRMHVVPDWTSSKPTCASVWRGIADVSIARDSSMPGCVRSGAQRVIAASAGAVLVAALAACSPNTDASPTTSTSASISSSSSASAGVILDLPEIAGEHSKAGAREFARFVLELTDRGYVRADAAQLKSISAADCKGCQGLVERIQQLKEAGEHTREQSVWVTKTAWVEKVGNRHIVDVAISSHDADIVDAAGVKRSVQKGEGDLAFRLALEWRGKGWIVRNFDLLTS